MVSLTPTKHFILFHFILLNIKFTVKFNIRLLNLIFFYLYILGNEIFYNFFINSITSNTNSK